MRGERRRARGIGVCASMVAAMAVVASTARAQGFAADVGYASREGVDLASYRLGFTAPLTGPVWWQLHGVLLKDNGAAPVERYGAGLELNAGRGRSGPYLAASLDAGVESGGPDDVWGSWTAGAGYDLRIVGGLGLATDVRWRGFLSGEPGGVQLTVGLGYRWGGKRTAAASSAATPSAAAPAAAPPSAAVPAAAPAAAAPAATLAMQVVSTAREAMGQPYRYGGQGDDGFDCSGLIQYAYAQHGITVPRVSTEQAQVGDEISRNLEGLQPGDILTFSSSPSGTRVSHVGLYVGDGRFIHSASSRGVSESRLSADDPNGAWWYARWVGARRIVDGS